MAAKKQRHDKDKSNAKRQSPKPVAKNLEPVVQQQTDPALAIQRARVDPSSLSPGDVLQIQRTIGNRAVKQFLARSNQRRLTNPEQLTAITTRKQPIIQREHVLKEDRERAIANLKGKFADIEDSKYSKVTADKGEKFWDTYLKDTTLEQVIERILDNYLPEEEKARPINLKLIEEAPNGLRLIIEVTNHRAVDAETYKTQKTLFALNQLFMEDAGKLKVHIETVTAPGSGKQLFRNSLLPLFDSLKVEELTLTASRIGETAEGVVAWARYGFIPDQGAWDLMRKHGLKEIGGEKAEEWPPELEPILEKDSPRAIRELVLLSWQHRENVKPLLDSMLRSTLSWPGTLDLTNPQDREWVEKYTTGADVEEYLELLDK